jgi:uncharacterized protein DUF2568
VNGLVGLVLALRFFLEIGALVALGYWGFETGDGWLGAVLGIGAPFLAAVAWGAFVSPKAGVKLAEPLRLAVELLFFGAAAAALAGAGRPELAVAFAVVVLAHIALLYALGARTKTRV